MPHLYCVSCGARAFKNWDAEDTDDEDDFYCHHCDADTKWLTEAEFNEQRRRRRSGDQPRRESDDNRLPVRPFDEEQRRKLEEFQRREIQLLQKKALEEQRRAQEQHERERQNSLDNKTGPNSPHSAEYGRCSSPTAALLAKVEHSPPSTGTNRRGSSVVSSPAVPFDGLIDTLIREVPTLGAYVRRLQQEVKSLRRDKIAALEQVVVSQRQAEEVRSQNAALARDAGLFAVRIKKLQQKCIALATSNASLKAQLETFGGGSAAPDVGVPDGSRRCSIVPSGNAASSCVDPPQHRVSLTGDGEHPLPPRQTTDLSNMPSVCASDFLYNEGEVSPCPSTPLDGGVGAFSLSLMSLPEVTVSTPDDINITFTPEVPPNDSPGQWSSDRELSTYRMGQPEPLEIPTVSVQPPHAAPDMD